MKNGKKKILLAVGFGDHTLAQVNGAQKNFEALAGSSHLNRFKAVVMVGRSGDTYRHGNLSHAFAPDQTVFMTVPNSSNFLGFESLLKLGLTEGGFRHEKAESFDFLFPPKDYEISVVGNDFSGVFQSLFPQLKALGYKFSVYRDAIKPISAESVAAMKAVGPTWFYVKDKE